MIPGCPKDSAAKKTSNHDGVRAHCLHLMQNWAMVSQVETEVKLDMGASKGGGLAKLA